VPRKIKELRLTTTFEEAVKTLLRTLPPPASNPSTRTTQSKKTKKPAR
jgi:hypothetical protein